MKTETTLDELARMVANGFKEVHEELAGIAIKFDEFGIRFDKQDRKLEKLTKEVQATNKRIDDVIVPELNDHARRIKDLEIAAA